MYSLKLSVLKHIGIIPIVWIVIFITYVMFVYVQSFNLTLPGKAKISSQDAG